MLAACDEELDGGSCKVNMTMYFANAMPCSRFLANLHAGHADSAQVDSIKQDLHAHDQS